MLNAIQHVNLRQAALQWALETAVEGEAPASVVARAEEYLTYVLNPLKPEVVAAMNERLVSTTH